MKKALNAWTVDDKTGFDDMFKQLKNAGFDGVELNLDKIGSSQHSLTMETAAEELLEIKKISDKYKLPVVSVSTSLYGGNLGSDSPEGNDLAKKILEKQLFCAKALGAGGILCVPGGISETQSILNAHKTAYDALVSAKPIIDEYKIPVGLENVWNAFFLSPWDMADFIDSLESEYVTAYYDVGNTVAFSWTQYWIEILGGRVSHIHIKDFKRKAGPNGGGDFVDLLEGSVNWPKVVENLKKIGFDGYLTAEVFKTDKNLSYEDYYKQIAVAIDKIINL